MKLDLLDTQGGLLAQARVVLSDLEQILIW